MFLWLVLYSSMLSCYVRLSSLLCVVFASLIVWRSRLIRVHWRKRVCLQEWASMVARLKLQGVDGKGTARSGACGLVWFDVGDLPCPDTARIDRLIDVQRRNLPMPKYFHISFGSFASQCYLVSCSWSATYHIIVAWCLLDRLSTDYAWYATH